MEADGPCFDDLFFHNSVFKELIALSTAKITADLSDSFSSVESSMKFACPLHVAPWSLNRGIALYFFVVSMLIN